MDTRPNYNLEERLIDFAALIIAAVKHLPKDRTGIHLAGQLLRSGTSPALNYGEALGAESRRDFVHKLKIVVKELRETLTCSRVLVKVSYLPSGHPILKECNELIAIFVKSVETAKRNMVLERKAGS